MTTSASRHHDRVAVITGGANGIGQAIAARLAAEGARIAVLDTSDATATEALAPVGRIVGYRADLTDAGSIGVALGRVRDELGDPAILVHSAAYQTVIPFADLREGEWELTMDVNVGGAYRMIREVLPGMRAAGWGRIVLVTSSSFFAPPAGMTHYIASKGALIGLVRGLAVDVGADGVTVNALAPGLTRTANAVANVPQAHFDTIIARQAIKRSGEPTDQAAAASFLVSDDAGFMTGQTLLMDGGEGHV